MSLARYFKLYDRLERAMDRGMRQRGWTLEKVFDVWSKYLVWSMNKAKGDLRERAKRN